MKSCQPTSELLQVFYTAGPLLSPYRIPHKVCIVRNLEVFYFYLADRAESDNQILHALCIMDYKTLKDPGSVYTHGHRTDIIFRMFFGF